MANHVKVLAYLHIAFGAILIFFGLLALLLFGGLAGIAGRSDDIFVVPVLRGLGGVVFVVMLLLGLPEIIAAWGLLNFRPWARVLTIILSAIHLMNVPLGTALGVYGLWVLLSRDGQQLFETRIRTA
ncbi:MAG: hypothetical protein IRZ15_01405 [Bryobacteraceae bacterium]|nr:hypothetical protein [Bryobacteraceae bacterium]